MAYKWFLIIIPLISAGNIPCRDEAACGEEAICCNISTFEWCCPIEKECCNDEIDCCPRRNMVIPSVQKLIKNSSPSYKALRKSPTMINFLRMMQSTKAKRIGSISVHPAKRIRLPSINGFQRCDKEGLYFCRDQETCCQVGSTWQCCRYRNGTCCKDQQHCCPSNTTCDPSSTTKCNDNYISVPAAPMVATRTSNQVAEVIFCPDHRQLCEETNTCCLIGIDTYGCCPYQNAVCCADLTHCCPSDTRCDVSEKRCFPPPIKK